MIKIGHFGQIDFWAFLTKNDQVWPDQKDRFCRPRRAPWGGARKMSKLIFSLGGKKDSKGFRGRPFFEDLGTLRDFV